MYIVIHSFLLVAATEMGDKTQLLALILASRFKRPWTILAGIFVATILNHALAAFVGDWVSQMLPEHYLKWILASLFFAFAIWVLIPDKVDEEKAPGRFGAFLTTLFAFFLAEMGDKTQLSTIALAAEYQNLTLVTLGTTLGMMFSNGLAVFFGKKVTDHLPLKWIHIFASLLFVAFGLWIILG